MTTSWYSIDRRRPLLLLLLFTFGLLTAVFGQQTPSYPKERLTERIEKIRRQYAVSVSYDALQLKDKYAPAIHSPEMLPISSVLNLSLKKTGLHYRQIAEDSYYILYEDTVIIDGLVVDGQSGEPLAGATITIGTTQVIANADGAYSLSVPRGRYEIRVSAVSHITRVIPEAAIKTTSYRHLSFALDRRVIGISPVFKVSNIARESIRMHYLRQQNAPAITDGLVAPQIANMPDQNLSELLKRINGVDFSEAGTIGIRGLSERYNQVSVDGIALPGIDLNKRSFSLDVFPKELISNVIISKTALAGNSPEFSGGQVQVNTLNIPAGNFTKLSIGTGANTQAIAQPFYMLGQEGKWDLTGLDDGTRKSPGPLAAKNRAISNNGLIPTVYRMLPNLNLNISLGRTYTLNKGLQLGFIYGTSLYRNQNLVYFNNIRGGRKFNYLDSSKRANRGEEISYRNQSGSGTIFNTGLEKGRLKLALKNLLTTRIDDPYNEAYRPSNEPKESIPVNEQFENPQQSLIRQHKIEGAYKIKPLLEFLVYGAYTRVSQKILDQRKLKYYRTTGGPDDPVFNTPNLATPALPEPDPLMADSRMWVTMNEKDYNWGIAFHHTTAKKNLKTAIGYAGLAKHRALDLLRFLPFTQSPASRTITGNYADLLDPANTQSPAFYQAEKTNGTAYSGTVINHALYGMADQKLSKLLRLIYGLRAEYYAQTNDQAGYLGKKYNDNLPAYYEGGITNEKTWLLFPSAHMIYTFMPDMNLRASYATTILHPDFREQAYLPLYDYELDATITGRQLVSGKANNYDLRWEWYTGPGEIVSAAAFYKKLHDPVELAQIGEGAYGYMNQLRASSYGAEFELRKSLNFMASGSGLLTHLLLQINATVNHSKVAAMTYPVITTDASGKERTISERLPAQNRPLFNQVPWVINAGLFYQSDRAGIGLFYNKKGPRTFLTNSNPNLTEYKKGADLLDLQLHTECLKNKGKLSLSLINLVNPWNIYYNNKNAFHKDASGVYRLTKGSIRYDSRDGDELTYRSRQGLNILLRFSYLL